MQHQGILSADAQLDSSSCRNKLSEFIEVFTNIVPLEMHWNQCRFPLPQHHHPATSTNLTY